MCALVIQPVSSSSLGAGHCKSIMANNRHATNCLTYLTVDALTVDIFSGAWLGFQCVGGGLSDFERCLVAG